MFAISRSHPHPRVPMPQPRRSASYLERPPKVISVKSADGNHSVEAAKIKKADERLAAVVHLQKTKIQREISQNLKRRQWHFHLDQIPQKNAEILTDLFKQLGFTASLRKEYWDARNEFNPPRITIALPDVKPSALTAIPKDLQAQFLPNFNPDELWKRLNWEYKSYYNALRKEVAYVIEDTNNSNKMEILVDAYDSTVINWVIEDLKENGYDAEVHNGPDRVGSNNYLRITLGKV